MLDISVGNRSTQIPSAEMADQAITIFEQYDEWVDGSIARWFRGIVPPQDYFPNVNTTGIFNAYRFGYLFPGEAVRADDEERAALFGLLIANQCDSERGVVEKKNHAINRHLLKRQGVKIIPDCLEVYEIPGPRDDDALGGEPRRLRPNKAILLRD